MIDHTIFERIRDAELSMQEVSYASVSDPEIEHLCCNLQPDGSWPDIDYADQRRSFWDPANHLSHLLTMLAAGGRKRLSADKSFRDKAIAAFDFWLKNDIQCPNWWHNQIGVPNRLCVIALFLQDYLTPEQQAKCSEILLRGTVQDETGPGSWTGANLMWGLKTTLKHALLRRDADSMAYAVRRLDRAVEIGGNEGMQTDHSFFQHGHQLQMGHYGWSFIGDIIPLCRILTGTPFQISGEKLHLIERYILEGMQYMVYKNRWNYFALGRSLFRPNTQDASKMPGMIELFAAVEEVQDKDSLRTVAQMLRGDKKRTTPDKYFHIGEYYCRLDDGYYIGARVSDPNVWPGEICNGEGVIGYNLASGGAQCILVDGTEYDNIAPIWDYAKIPGVTTLLEDDAAICAKRGWDSRPAKNTYCGGVCDGKKGVIYMDLNHNGITGVMSRFFIDGGMIAMGAGLCAETGRVISTVNQCWNRSEIVQNSSTVVHDNITYLNLCSTPWTAETKPQTGSWQRVAAEDSDAPFTGAVFSLWYDHGEAPKDGQYAYALLPNCSNSSLQAEDLDVEILQNSLSCQAICAGSEVFAVFHASGRLSLPDGSVLEGEARSIQTALLKNKK